MLKTNDQKRMEQMFPFYKEYEDNSVIPAVGEDINEKPLFTLLLLMDDDSIENVKDNMLKYPMGIAISSKDKGEYKTFKLTIEMFGRDNFYLHIEGNNKREKEYQEYFSSALLQCTYICYILASNSSRKAKYFITGDFEVGECKETLESFEGFKSLVVCPKCGKWFRKGEATISRENDYEICSECGTKEALDEAKKNGLLS